MKKIDPLWGRVSKPARPVEPVSNRLGLPFFSTAGQDRNPVPTKMQIALLFALRRESMFFLRTLPDLQKVPAPFPAWRGKTSDIDLLILEMGIGRHRARQALAWLASRPQLEGLPFSADCLVSAGFGGALSPSLQVGDVVQAHEVMDEQNNLYPVRSHASPARLVTVSRLVAKAEEKQSLAEKYQAQVVDMESAEVARFAQEKGLPLICLRAISDDARTELSPYLVPLLCGGKVSPRRLAWALMRRPWLVGQLWRLGKATRLAGKNLAQSLNEMLRPVPGLFSKHAFAVPSGRASSSD